jgi:hypothetical protein
MAMVERWLVYQQERFPLARHAPLVLVTCLCALAFTLGLQNEARWPSLIGWFGSSLVTLGLFFLLRVLDEFKDFEDDSRFRPYRPVPRGLLRLEDLARAGWLVAGLQLFVTLVFAPLAVLPLIVCWAFMALMALEFFVPEWLKARPLIYMLSHAPITGLIQLQASAWVWMDTMPGGVIWLAFCATAVGIMLELGRKIRAPEDEEPGVDTYSASWGIPRAITAWLLAGAIAAILTLISSFGWFSVIGLSILGASSLWLGLRFQAESNKPLSKWFEPASAVWALIVFASLALKGLT